MDILVYLYNLLSANLESDHSNTNCIKISSCYPSYHSKNVGRFAKIDKTLYANKNYERKVE